MKKKEAGNENFRFQHNREKKRNDDDDGRGKNSFPQDDGTFSLFCRNWLFSKIHKIWIFLSHEKREKKWLQSKCGCPQVVESEAKAKAIYILWTIIGATRKESGRGERRRTFLPHPKRSGGRDGTYVVGCCEIDV